MPRRARFLSFAVPIAAVPALAQPPSPAPSPAPTPPAVAEYVEVTGPAAAAFGLGALLTVRDLFLPLQGLAWRRVYCRASG